MLDSLIQSAEPGGATSRYGSIQFVESISSGADAETVLTPWNVFLHKIGLAEPSTVEISMLDLGSQFFNDSPYSAAVTILHELGHVLANLNWKNDQIVPDGPQTSQSNTDKVTSNCGNDLAKLAGAPNQ